MSIRHILGSDQPVKTGVSTTRGGNKLSSIVEVEGPISVLEAIADVTPYVPQGMSAENWTVERTYDGFGKLAIRCVDYGTGSVSTTPTRTTWKITMAEVQTDLKRHPHFNVSARKEIEKWLNTDPEKRYDTGGQPQYVDSEGQSHLLTAPATDYVTAYEKGIENYLRHYPIIEKISYYKTLPGCSMSGNSTTSGTVDQFSSNIDTWNVPGVKLSGYSDNGWFKSGDNYDQGNDLVWIRTEQWTWTPDGSTSNTGWIYQSS